MADDVSRKLTSLGGHRATLLERRSKQGMPLITMPGGQKVGANKVYGRGWTRAQRDAAKVDDLVACAVTCCRLAVESSQLMAVGNVGGALMLSGASAAWGWRAQALREEAAAEAQEVPPEGTSGAGGASPPVCPPDGGKERGGL